MKKNIGRISIAVIAINVVLILIYLTSVNNSEAVSIPVTVDSNVSVNECVDELKDCIKRANKKQKEQIQSYTWHFTKTETDSVLFDEKTIYINADGNVRDNIESALKIIFEEV